MFQYILQRSLFILRSTSIDKFEFIRLIRILASWDIGDEGNFPWLIRPYFGNPCVLYEFHSSSMSLLRCRFLHLNIKSHLIVHLFHSLVSLLLSYACIPGKWIIGRNQILSVLRCLLLLLLLQLDALGNHAKNISMLSEFLFIRQWLLASPIL